MDMQKIERMLEKVQKPARYMGGEMNTQLKPWEEAEVRFAFGFPDSYEVAMSHLGMKILYALINDQPWALCERVCMPWVDMIAEMEKEGVELFSLENRKPLRAFDIVGFTLQYEMSYTNILNMMDMGGIPVKREDRVRDAAEKGIRDTEEEQRERVEFFVHLCLELSGNGVEAFGVQLLH